MHSSICLIGGLGDIVSVFAHMSPEYRRHIRKIYWAAYRGNALQAITRKLPDFRKAEHHTIDVGEHGPSILTLPDLKAYCGIELPDDVEDWSITTKFPQIVRGEYAFHGCPYLECPLASITKVNLPAHYVVIQGMTPANPTICRECRDLESFEWRAIDRRLARQGLKGVVLDVPGDPLPIQSDRILDRRGLTLGQSIEVLKDERCVGYWGIDSFLSILASARFDDPNDLIIRAQNQHYHEWKGVYGAPHRRFPHVVREIR